MLGKEHPNTLMSMNSLASALSKQGKNAEAEAMHRETLALGEKVLGKEHPDTLISMSNLAQALCRQRKNAEAEVLHRETLALREKVLGKEHPHTLSSISLVALSLQLQHRYQEALPLYEHAYTGYQKILGPDDPDTRACFTFYSVARCKADALLSANKTHELANRAPKSVHFDHANSSPVELALRLADKSGAELNDSSSQE